MLVGEGAEMVEGSRGHRETTCVLPKGYSDLTDEKLSIDHRYGSEMDSSFYPVL